MNFNANDLDAISEYAYQLKLLGMIQSAGNYDYLVAWIKSPLYNGSSYLPPHPAGNNTIDEYSHNCPIPYYDPYEYRNCSDIDKAVMLLKYIATHIDNLKAYIDNDLEQTAILSYKGYTANIIESCGGTVEPDPEPEPPGPIPVDKYALFGILSATSDTKFDFDNDLLYGIMYKDIDIDTTFGSDVTIPNGYTVDSILTKQSYHYGEAISSGYDLLFKAFGQDVYHSGDMSSLININILPCLYVFQISRLNANYTVKGGYRITSTTSMYDGSGVESFSNVSTNSNGNFFEFTATYLHSGDHAWDWTVVSNIADASNNFPSQCQYYDSDDNTPYYFNLPSSMWEFSNGVLSWIYNDDLVDSRSKKDASFYYKHAISGGVSVRIHCVHE